MSSSFYQFHAAKIHIIFLSFLLLLFYQSPLCHSRYERYIPTVCCATLRLVGSHVSSDTWTTIHRNTHPPTDVRVFRRLDNPRAQLLYAHIRPLAQMLSALAVPLFYMVLLPWYCLYFAAKIHIIIQSPLCAVARWGISSPSCDPRRCCRRLG